MVNNIIDVSATWCGPCRALKEELADFDMVPIIKIDADEDEQKCAELNVRNLPVLIFMNENNEEIERHVGFVTKQQLIDIINKINEVN